jgi:hypothetical protein
MEYFDHWVMTDYIVMLSLFLKSLNDYLDLECRCDMHYMCRSW